MPTPTVALKIDVDTYAGTREGVPRLLDLLNSHHARGTFYFCMGPDHTGRALRRIVTHRGFLQKALRSGAPSAYGLKTMLYGVLLPGPLISKQCASVMRETVRQGHEPGIHAWNHVDWHDHLIGNDIGFAKSELGQAAAAFKEIFGHLAASTAAPGWTVSHESLALQDQMQLSFCSDARGTHPFYPVVDGKRFTTLQIPTTLPTADELLGRNGLQSVDLPEYYLHALRPGLNVLTIHAELEGGCISSYFDRLLRLLHEHGIPCITLAEAAASVAAAPACNLAMGMIAGRALPVALQGTELP
ncbi:polysaccharide deacetylase family protein [Trichlorobacter ammonificans]|uniref:Polymyxin resistance protein PmrJ, predicted deacetylase n=1 Tax=Trichlorobacter ammonificans TaxID=2916410 RepID=A0ABM9DB33_9BACT|nr:polysaccharide deacetylase family protein [Trichlorobacter ammonificans]CAH2032442.1 Polymyxin resistance protein PmrJ, predicted deacetylase [Trichlorobacter ammonificans]